MAYTIKLSKEGTKRQILSTKDNIFISRSQIKELNRDLKDKNVSGVYVYLDKGKK